MTRQSDSMLTFHEGAAAIVTGASSGIGSSVARLFAANGVSVLGVGRNEERLNALADTGDIGEIAVLVQDVTTPEAPSLAVATAMERFGRLDFLINNAGIGMPKAVHETSDEELDAFLDVHLRATFRLCREALGVLGAGASIVNVSSTFGVIGGLRGGAYSAAKAAVIGLSKHMAAQYGAQGIRTNVVAPGVIATPMTDYAWETERFKRMNFEMTPSDTTGTPEDVAHAIAYLCSQQARFINGQTLVIDGGWSSTKYLAPEAVEAERVE